MTIHGGPEIPLDAADEPSADVIAIVIKAIGHAFVMENSAIGHGETGRNFWGSEQRAKLLLALIDQVAANAAEKNNAALSATDGAIARFSKVKFIDGSTRSAGDRMPIRTNVSKVVGAWLRRMMHVAGESGRRKDVVSVDWSGRLTIRGEASEWRSRLTFSYPLRVVPDRRLRITAAVARRIGGAWRSSRFPSDPTATNVELPGAPPSSEDAHLADLLESLHSYAVMKQDPELAEFARTGMRRFASWSGQKMLGFGFAALLASFALIAVAELASHRYFRKRLEPSIRTRCTPEPRVELTFAAAPKGGISVRRDGAPLPEENGVFLDAHPILGATNVYEIRARRRLIVPWVQRATIVMPACPPPPPPPPLDVHLQWAERHGILDVTRDTSGRGDPPVSLAAFNVDVSHLDPHLDVFVGTEHPETCSICDQSTVIYGTLMVVMAPDVRVTLSFGDHKPPVILHGSSAMQVKPNQTEPPAPLPGPRLYKLKNPNDQGSFYALTVPHYFDKPGTYDLSARVESRSSKKEPYNEIEVLKHRVRIGVKASIETHESYRFPEQANAPQSH